MVDDFGEPFRRVADDSPLRCKWALPKDGYTSRCYLEARHVNSYDGHQHLAQGRLPWQRFEWYSPHEQEFETDRTDGRPWWDV